MPIAVAVATAFMLAVAGLPMAGALSATASASASCDWLGFQEKYIGSASAEAEAGLAAGDFLGEATAAASIKVSNDYTTFVDQSGEEQAFWPDTDPVVVEFGWGPEELDHQDVVKASAWAKATAFGQTPREDRAAEGATCGGSNLGNVACDILFSGPCLLNP